MTLKQTFNSSIAPDGSTYITLTDGNGNLVTAGGGAALSVGSTTITGGTSGDILYDNAGVLGNTSTPNIGVATGTSLALSGTVGVVSKGSIFGTASGTSATGAVTLADANILLYNFGSANWAGIGADSGGNVWVKAGTTGTPVPAFWLNGTDQSAHVTSTIVSTSPTTGALTIAGGAGIGGALNVGGGIVGTPTVTSSTVSSLPTGTLGQMIFCSNCRVFNGAGVQEGSGLGTGGLVSYNGTAWKIVGTNVTAVA